MTREVEGALSHPSCSLIKGFPDSLSGLVTCWFCLCDPPLTSRKCFCCPGVLSGQVLGTLGLSLGLLETARTLQGKLWDPLSFCGKGRAGHILGTARALLVTRFSPGRLHVCPPG